MCNKGVFGLCVCVCVQSRYSKLTCWNNSTLALIQYGELLLYTQYQANVASFRSHHCGWARTFYYACLINQFLYTGIFHTFINLKYWKWKTNHNHCNNRANLVDITANIALNNIATNLKALKAVVGYLHTILVHKIIKFAQKLQCVLAMFFCSEQERNNLLKLRNIASAWIQYVYITSGYM